MYLLFLQDSCHLCISCFACCFFFITVVSLNDSATAISHGLKWPWKHYCSKKPQFQTVSEKTGLFDPQVKFLHCDSSVGVCHLWFLRPLCTQFFPLVLVNSTDRSRAFRQCLLTHKHDLLSNYFKTTISQKKKTKTAPLITCEDCTMTIGAVITLLWSKEIFEERIPFTLWCLLHPWSVSSLLHQIHGINILAYLLG